MGFFDALFGRTRLKKPDLDPLFAVTSAAADLEAKAIRLEDVAGISYRPVETDVFASAEKDVRALLDLYVKEHGVAVETAKDAFDFTWVIARGGAEADDRITALHLVADKFSEAGFGGELLAAAFPGKDHHGDRFYLVYNYKRSSFYPFRPLPGKERDNAAEIRLQGMLEGILPVERELERWYGLWELPF